MIATTPTSMRSRVALLLTVAAGMAAFLCTLIGQGQLHISNDESGIGANNTILRAYAHNTGDFWPGPGEIGVLVQGDDFGTPPSYGLNGTLLLVSTNAECPMSEGAPETFAMSDVTSIGSVPVVNGTVNQAFRVTDNASARAPRWALIEPDELAGFPGEHKIHRCGTVTWVATGSAVVDPCVLRSSLEGNPLTPGLSFALGLAKWQFCYGGAAAGSNEKFLFFTTDGGATWELISRTTLGSPPPEAGVGELPNGNGVSALFFQDLDKGWLGLSSPGHNLLKSTDGGHNWQEVVVTGLDPGEPVTSISFSSATDGTFTTPDATFTTDDGGTTWDEAP